MLVACSSASSSRVLLSERHRRKGEDVFRPRLETLEKNLAGHRFTILDSGSGRSKKPRPGSGPFFLRLFKLTSRIRGRESALGAGFFRKTSVSRLVRDFGGGMRRVT